LDAHDLLVQVVLLLLLLRGAYAGRYVYVDIVKGGWSRVPKWNYKMLKIVLVSYYSIKVRQ